MRRSSLPIRRKSRKRLQEARFATSNSVPFLRHVKHSNCANERSMVKLSS